MDKWKTYTASSGPSSLQWLDDGPLSNPAFFGGFWVPWRDDEGLPYATYSALGISKRDNIASGDGESDGDEVTKGESDGSGDNTWKLTPDQKEDQKEELKLTHQTERQTHSDLASVSSSSSGSGVAHPYLLLGSGAVLGMVATVAVVSRLNKRNSYAKLPPV